MLSVTHLKQDPQLRDSVMWLVRNLGTKQEFEPRPVTKLIFIKPWSLAVLAWSWWKDSEALCNGLKMFRDCGSREPLVLLRTGERDHSSDWV